ncbi:DNA polymerase I [Loigolactobacillus backii]|uniref:DNA polymerase I n=1 Tax=Loigolactobacillus backii TaxID=375175 RepID=A0A192H1M3_9LACO|nr:DNA polymerase I [Loigolactobacillus backii]ANK59296.1 DNA polymerase I [Loigolactobacillus backii]ANK62709.1 DNA polymerase I [Loigolactobacillus backii]ANK64288.1 DNA polymerase I [Loigolactobacillus backii]ANK67318.1 DNA polymerase I [Loigolactobacillus backii]ANK70283.1 DNA polymerase I [Loigolactobacillus backii]
MATDKHLLLIDGNSVAFRAFFALHSQVNTFINHDGLHTNAIYAFNTMLDVVLKEFKPTHVLVAFDAGKTTFRTKEFAEYKSQRAKTPSELSEQLPYLRQLLTAYGIKSYELANYEADDIIGTLAKEASQAGFQVDIVTGDRDLTQLATAEVTVNVTVKGVNQTEAYTPEHVMEKYGLQPKQIIDMKGLAGDTSDNYPGVRKVGEKTAIKLLKEYDSVEGVYEHLDDLKASKMKEHLQEDRSNAFLSKKLATINTAAPIKVSVTELKRQERDLDKLIEFYKEMDFNSFLSKLDSAVAPTEVAAKTTIKFEQLTNENIKQVLAKFSGPVVFYLEMLASNYHTSDFAGFVIGQEDHWYFGRDIKLLQQPDFVAFFADNQQAKLVFDLKRTFVGLNRLGIRLNGTTFDLLLASYLLNTNDNSNDLGKIAQLHQYSDVATDEEVYGKGSKKALPENETEFAEHLARKARAIEQLQPKLSHELEANDQIGLFNELEIPLALVLAQMEIAGIKIDKDRLNDMRGSFKERIQQIQEKIYAEAEEEFNINSSKQLGAILFEKMNLPVIKKTKTGYSTAVGVLEKLKGIAPIASDVLDYRGLTKIQSTYITGLLKVIHPEDGKIHTTYLQTLTQTGRLSSIDPNLQNIPVRDEDGRQIRQAFVPREKGWQIFAADYSQIELRVLAHISHDKNLQAAFKEGMDIHASTAMRIFNLDSPADVTPNMRREAKAVNFGIVYGISDYGLSQNIGITRLQAKNYIDNYFREYPNVQKYMTDIVQSAKDHGYVETLFHRRRYLPDINAKNFNLRSFAERTAMNTPIQGSAADIIKVAMLNMHKALEEHKLKATMLLQVHDELIFEAPDDEIPVLRKLVPQVMDSAVDLEVPMKVGFGSGPTWYNVKD